MQMELLEIELIKKL